MLVRFILLCALLVLHMPLAYSQPSKSRKSGDDSKAISIVSIATVLALATTYLTAATPSAQDKFEVAYRRFDSTVLNEIEHEAVKRGDHAGLEAAYDAAFDRFIHGYDGPKVVIGQVIKDARHRVQLRAIDDASAMKYGKRGSKAYGSRR
jgi:hypothetical protein